MSPPPIDRGYAWVIVFATFLPQLLYIGFLKSGGLLLVEIMKTFNASSSQAALTFTLINVANCISSMLVLIVLEARIQKRLLSITGALLFTLGLVSGYFSSQYLHVVIPYGICAGMGLAFMYGPQMIILRQYFHHRQSVAFGVAVSGVSIGTALMPLLFRHLLDEYGFHGAMLLVGGTILNCAVFGALLRPIETYKISQVLDRERERTSQSRDDLSNADGHSSCSITANLPEKIDICVKENSNESHRDDLINSQAPINGSHYFDKVSSLTMVQSYNTVHQVLEEASLLCHGLGRDPPCTLESVDKNTEANTDTYNVIPKYRNTEITTHLLDQNKYIKSEPEVGGRGKQIDLITNADMASSMISLNVHTQQTPNKAGVNRTKLLDLSLLKQPAFLAFLIFASFCHSGSIVVLIYIPAHAADLGFTVHQMDTLISIIGATDLVGRLSVGVVAQSGILKRHNLLAVCMIIVGLAQHVSRFLVVYWSLVVCISVFGVFAGTFYSLGPLVIADFFGVKMMPKVMGVMMLTQGVLYACVNALCAWLRDYTGSYAACFHLLGSLAIVGAIVLFIIPKLCTLKGTTTDYED